MAEILPREYPRACPAMRQMGLAIWQLNFRVLPVNNSFYTAAQLRAYRSGARYQPDDNLNMMKMITSYMTEQEIEAVAEYISGLH